MPNQFLIQKVGGSGEGGKGDGGGGGGGGGGGKDKKGKRVKVRVRTKKKPKGGAGAARTRAGTRASKTTSKSSKTTNKSSKSSNYDDDDDDYDEDDYDEDDYDEDDYDDDDYDEDEDEDDEDEDDEDDEEDVGVRFKSDSGSDLGFGMAARRNVFLGAGQDGVGDAMDDVAVEGKNGVGQGKRGKRGGKSSRGRGGHGDEGASGGKRKASCSRKWCHRGYRRDFLCGSGMFVLMAVAVGVFVIPNIVDPKENTAGEPDYTDLSFSLPLILGCVFGTLFLFAFVFLFCRGSRHVYARRQYRAGKFNVDLDDLSASSMSSDTLVDSSYQSASEFGYGDDHHTSTRNPFYFVPDET